MRCSLSSGVGRTVARGTDRTSGLDEPVEPALRVAPLPDDLLDPPRRLPAAQQAEQPLAALPVTLRDHGDPAVVEVAGLPDEPQLQRPRPGPPAETHALHATPHPGGEPNGRIVVAAHRLATLPGRDRSGAPHAGAPPPGRARP